MEDNRKNSTEEQQWDDYVLRIADICESIPLHKVTILTGRNGGGKSMIMKLMPAYMTAREELQGRTGSIVASIYMDIRAGINPERGFMSMFDRDIEWFPTSENTFTSVEGLLKQTDRFLVLDELELGMGEELQAGLAMWINERLSDVLEKNLGILVITHSRTQ